MKLHQQHLGGQRRYHVRPRSHVRWIYEIATANYNMLRVASDGASMAPTTSIFNSKIRKTAEEKRKEPNRIRHVKLASVEVEDYRVPIVNDKMDRDLDININHVWGQQGGWD
jgi:hypothetical protein